MNEGDGHLATAPWLATMIEGSKSETLKGKAVGGKNLLTQKHKFDHFRLFIVATGCPSERRPQKKVSC